MTAALFNTFDRAMLILVSAMPVAAAVFIAPIF